MKTPRAKHACGIAIDSETEEQIVIVVGGYDERRPVEIWVRGTNEWVDGPEDEYFHLYGAGGISFDGAFYVVGGYHANTLITRLTIYRFTCSNRECQEKQVQSLTTRRGSFAVMFVPDEFC